MSMDAITGDLFAQIPAPSARADADESRQEVAAMVSQIAREYSGDRYELAVAMSRISGKEFTKNMVDAWASASREDHNIPLYAAAILAAVTHDHRLTDWLCTQVGAIPLYGKQIQEAQLGKMVAQKNQLLKAITKQQRLVDTMGAANNE